MCLSEHQRTLTVAADCKWPPAAVDVHQFSKLACNAIAGTPAMQMNPKAR
jgi:hypothetical protein